MSEVEAVSLFRSAFPLCPPIGFALCNEYEELWLRLHTLPADRRIPENTRDERTVLERVGAVTDWLFCSGESVCCYAYDSIKYADRLRTSAVRLPIITVLPSDWYRYLNEYLNAPRLAFLMGCLPWEFGRFDELVLRRAHDDIGSLCFMSVRDGGKAVSVYDGGIDIFVRDSNIRLAATERFGAWLPTS